METTSQKFILSLLNGIYKIEIRLANKKSDANVALT
jgi:hypothetical protein